MKIAFDDRRFRDPSRKSRTTLIPEGKIVAAAPSVEHPLVAAKTLCDAALRGERISNEFTVHKQERNYPKHGHCWKIVVCDLEHGVMECHYCGQQVVVACQVDKCMGVD